MPTIKYFTRNRYGTDYRYPLEERYAVPLRLLTGTLTITKSAEIALKQLGFDLEEVLEPKEKPSNSII